MSKRSPVENQTAFARALVEWFGEVGKDYPWRRTRDPYAVLVSELMLQQTQVATVLSRRYFENWMEKFPTPALLSAAPEEAVLKAWEGLGYYRRARHLQKAAVAIVAEHGGEFPRDPEAILALPGVGRYTAGAVASFAFGDAAPIVDGNIARVLARLFDFREEIDSTAGARQLWAWADELVPGGGGARDYNSGLMELGQTLCSVADPACGDCPVARFCLAESPGSLPKRKPRVKTTRVDEHVRLVVDGERVLLEQETGRRREGLWKLPPLPESRLGVAEVLLEMKYSITRYRVTLRVCADGRARRSGKEAAAAPGQAWFTRDEVESLAMPSPYRKALVALAEGGRVFS